MWQPPTSPGADTPAGAPPQQGPYPPAWDAPAPPQWDSQSAPPWVQGPGPWSPPPGTWWPQPPAPAPRRPRSRKVVVAIVVACVLGVVVLGAAIAGVFAMGRAAADRATSSASASVTPSPPVAATGLGDDADLNGYATRCHDGDMQACDDLYDQSDPMSRYEQYGMTCGGRVKPFDVEYCTDLD
ncbi:MAG: hypothetical protein QOJ68_42 [Blastococcus sp.]|nr:hypothetical protein [Blastococcus sp.]